MSSAKSYWELKTFVQTIKPKPARLKSAVDLILSGHVQGIEVAGDGEKSESKALVLKSG